MVSRDGLRLDVVLYGCERHSLQIGRLPVAARDIVQAGIREALAGVEGPGGVGDARSFLNTVELIDGGMRVEYMSPVPITSSALAQLYTAWAVRLRSVFTWLDIEVAAAGVMMTPRRR